MSASVEEITTDHVLRRFEPCFTETRLIIERFSSFDETKYLMKLKFFCEDDVFNVNEVFDRTKFSI
jgi:hypothetical protein